MKIKNRRLGLVALVSTAAFALTACGGGSAGSTESSSPASAPASASASSWAQAGPKEITDMAGEAARLLQRQIRRQRDGAPLKPEHLLMNFSLIRRQSDAAPRVRPPAHFLPPQAPRPVDAEMASTTPPSA